MQVPEQVEMYYRKNLSAFSLVYKHLKSTYFFLFSVLLFSIGFFILIKYPNSLYSLIGLAFTTPIMASSFILKRFSKKFIEQKWQVQIPINSSVETAIKDEQFKRLDSKIRSLGYTSGEKIDDLIDMYELPNEKSRFERLLPLSILVVLILPIWNEYVGFRYNAMLREITNQKVYNESFLLASKLLVMALMLWLFSVLVVKISRSIFLSSINKRERMCGLLRDISHEHKRIKGRAS